MGGGRFSFERRGSKGPGGRIEIISFNFRNECGVRRPGEGKPLQTGPLGQQTRELESAGGAVLLGRSDLVPPEPLYPAAHSFSRHCLEIEDNVRIFIEVKDGKVFFGIDNHSILA